MQAAEEGHQRHEEQVGKGDDAELDGQAELAGVVQKARRDGVHDPGHGGHGRHGQGQQHEKEDRQGLLGEASRRLRAFLFQAAREERHEGRVEGAFGEDPPEHVGKAEGDEKGVGRHAGAQHRGDQDVANKAEDAAAGGPAADGRHVTKQAHGGQSLRESGENGKLCGRRTGRPVA